MSPFCQVEFETEMMKDKRDKLTQLLMDLMERQKQRAEDLQVHFFQISLPAGNHLNQKPTLSDGQSLIDFILTITEDDGRDGDNEGGGAGELLADPVPEAAGQQAQGARGGRGQHGPQGDDCDVDAAYAADDGGDGQVCGGRA